jgi:hypothetical protein
VLSAKAKFVVDTGLKQSAADTATSTWWVWKKDEHGLMITNNGKKVPEASQPLFHGLNMFGGTNSGTKSDRSTNCGRMQPQGMSSNGLFSSRRTNSKISKLLSPGNSLVFVGGGAQA